MKADGDELQSVLDSVARDIQPRLGEGKVADYIPALARVAPDRFGMSVITCDGRMASTGDATELFSIQSVSKIFTLALALGKVGNTLWSSVGREPSGNSFNSIVQLEQENGIPRNPLIKAGAIVVTDILLSNCDMQTTREEILTFLQHLADDPSISIDEEVAASEKATGYRNESLAAFMKSFGNLKNSVDDALGVYYQQCAIAMNCNQLARAGLFLASAGRDPIRDIKIINPQRARRINALMLTCGHYDASGDFAFQVGLPGKSGVGGGILCIVPGERRSSLVPGSKQIRQLPCWNNCP